MSLTFTISSCCVKASKAKRWMCGSWLTFTTLESWAPLSNPSIDRERNETMNHTSLFLVSASQMALADVIPCLLSLVFIHNILRNSLQHFSFYNSFSLLHCFHCLFIHSSGFIEIFPIDRFKQTDQQKAWLAIDLFETQECVLKIQLRKYTHWVHLQDVNPVKQPNPTDSMSVECERKLENPCRYRENMQTLYGPSHLIIFLTFSNLKQ